MPFVVLQVFGQGIADSLHYRAVNLSLMPQWVQDCANIVGGCELSQLHLSRFHVYFHFGYLDTKDSNFFVPFRVVGVIGFHYATGTGNQVAKVH